MSISNLRGSRMNTGFIQNQNGRTGGTRRARGCDFDLSTRRNPIRAIGARAQPIALWRAYNHSCVYRNKPIDSLSHLEIDHIIPRHLLKTKQELRALLIRLGVPDLDLHSYKNWLPVHGRPCNRDKSGEVQPDTTLLNFLGVARRSMGSALD